MFALGGVALPIAPELPAGRGEILERHLTLGAVHEDGAYVFLASGSTGKPNSRNGGWRSARTLTAWMS